jgi:Nucleotidyl transferase AbiEii toxin, Type IV TA system
MKEKRSPASVLARLLDLARQRREDYSLLLNRFGHERLLDRLSRSRHADRFLLKGALLFSLWYDEAHRPTRDADLLGFGSDDIDQLTTTFRELAAIDLHDGIVFDPDSVRAEPIREDNVYGSVRVRLVGRIGSARCSLQVDVGFGDAVTPQPETGALPAVLPDFESPRLKVYPVYTVIAEQYQAMVVLAAANSRMKDFYDLAVIAARSTLEGSTLAQAIAATFARRRTTIPLEPPLCLRSEFAAAPAKRQQWQAFLARNRLAPLDLARTINVLHTLLWPATRVAASGSNATAQWIPQQTTWV